MAAASAAVADQPERLGGPSGHCRVGIAERQQQRGPRRGIANQSEGKGGHRTHLDLGVFEQTQQRLHAFGEADAAHGQRGAMAHPRLLVREQADQIRGWRRRDNGRFEPRGRPQHGLRRRIRIAQDALILEPHHPGQLLLPGDHGHGRRRGDGHRIGHRRTASAEQHERQQRGSDPARHAATAGGCRMTARRRRRRRRQALAIEHCAVSGCANCVG